MDEREFERWLEKIRNFKNIKEFNKAWERLVKEYGGKIRAIILKIGIRGEKVYDVMQDVYIKVLTGIHGFRGEIPQSFYAWLACIIRRACIDEIRKKENQLITDSLDSPLTTNPLATDERLTKELVSSDEPSPEEIIFKNELRGIVYKCLSKLSSTWRKIVEMYFFEGLNNAEIAMALNIPKGTVDSSKYKAIIKLRKCLKSELKKRGEDLGML